MPRQQSTLVSPDTDPDHRSCNQCHSHVSHSFARVFGTNSDEVHACPNCSSLNELYGAANPPERAPTPL